MGCCVSQKRHMCEVISCRGTRNEVSSAAAKDAFRSEIPITGSEVVLVRINYQQSVRTEHMFLNLFVFLARSYSSPWAIQSIQRGLARPGTQMRGHLWDWENKGISLFGNSMLSFPSHPSFASGSLSRSRRWCDCLLTFRDFYLSVRISTQSSHTE